MEISFSNVTKKYGSSIAVNQVNITLTNGVCALLGANGSGKTTLMRMLATVLRPTEGKILFDGRDIRILDASYRNLLGYLPQNFGYYKEFTVYDFLIYMCALKGIDGSFARERSIELLHYVGLYEHKKKKIKTFSGGMRQRVGIAQALLNDPSILILDEPTAGLDPKERIRFRNMMCEISKNRIIIYATHIIPDISYLAERVLIMKQGCIAADSSPTELLTNMQNKVWLLDTDKENLSLMQNQFTMGNIVSLENNHVRARIISDSQPCTDAVPAEPELDDVYLHYFGEASDHDNID